MKKKALVVMLVCIMGLAALAINNAEAAGPGWYTCTISVAGLNSSGVYFVKLTDTATSPAFTTTQFLLDTSTNRQNELYAAALTAIANSTNLWVYLGNSTANSIVYACSVSK